MGEFHGIFCCPFLPLVLLIEGMGGMGSMVGWEVAKKLFGTSHEQL